MGLTIGSLHMMGTLTQEQRAANPYRLERDGRVSLYDLSWENSGALIQDAISLSREIGSDILVFYCYDEDMVGLTLFRDGNDVASGAVSLDEGVSQTPQNMGLITAAFGIEDAGGAKLERLMTVARADVMRQIDELAEHLKLPLLPGLEMVERMETDKREQKYKRKRKTAKEIVDAYAQETFGERMAALGFTTFKYNRWYKLIRDEVLLSFGLVPYKGFFSMLLGIQPTFAQHLDYFMTETIGANPLPYVLSADDMLLEMQYWRHAPDSRHVHRGNL